MDFFYHPRMLAYDFGPQHPFRPERLARCVELLGRFGVAYTDPGEATLSDAARVHSEQYLNTFMRVDRLVTEHGQWDRSLSDDEFLEGSSLVQSGFLSSDNPPFPGMWQASLGFIGGTVSAAEQVRDGAPMALTLAAGLHHCARDRASGFCLLDDPAIACHILLERYDRVAYVDIDLHHGDGVQWIWFDDPRVLTCSIHESGRTLFPGTGFSEETGAEFTSLNIPLAAGTTGDVWLDAFRRGILPALERFRPQALVLQMGSDPHFSDPLGHLMVGAQEWLEAVKDIKSLGLPLVACGGGGYNLESAVRMWSAAILTLMGIEFEDAIPGDLAQAWSMPRFFDPLLPGPREQGRAAADAAVRFVEQHHLQGMPRP